MRDRIMMRYAGLARIKRDAVCEDLWGVRVRLHGEARRGVACGGAGMAARESSLHETDLKL